MNVSCAKDFYIEGNIAYEKFDQDKESYNNDGITRREKMPNVVGLNFGVGYYFTDKIRVGLLASVPFTNQFRTDLTQKCNK